MISDEDEDDDSISGSDFGQFQDENILEGFDDDEVLPIWKRIFHLPFEPVWSCAIVVLGVWSIYRCIYQACFKEYQKDSDEGQEFLLVVGVFYLIDIVIIIGGKNIRHLRVPPTEMRLPNWIIFCDILSIFPIELFVPTANITKFKAKLYYVLQVISCFKIARIYYVIYYHRNFVGNSKLFIQLCEIVFNSGLIISLGLIITHETICTGNNCELPLTWEKYINIMCITVTIITGCGNIAIPYDLVAIFFYSVLSLVFYFIVSCVSMCYVTIELFTRCKSYYIFLAKINLMNETYAKFNVCTGLVRRSQKYYNTLLVKRKGISANLNNFTNLPPAISEQIGIDFCLATFMHSSLFRQCDLPFLRYLSYFIKSKIMLPGDTVYEHRSVKAQLVYVASGVIQILSEEDGITPILSFSSGTCLGELSLFVSYTSRVRVCCKTYCNLYVLTKKDFMQAVLKVYPERYRDFTKIISKRISDAKQHYEVAQHFNADEQFNNKTDLITIMWLKSTLHRLMIKDGDTLSKHECQNIFLRSEFDKDRFKNKFFIPDYLDTLVISERVELVTDTVFLRSTCPCVFQAHSIVLQSWNYIILFLAIITSFMIPFNAFVNLDASYGYYAFVQTITVFWWLDLYVQTSTAVVTSYEMISNINEIFYYRITTVGFIIDIIAAIPLDLFSCVLLSSFTDQYRALLHLNRILKIYRVERFFQSLESNSDEIIAKFYLQFVCYFVYFIYFYTCILYKIRCYNSTCPPDADFNDLLWHAVVVIQTMTSTTMNTKYANGSIYYVAYIFLAIFSTFLYIFSNAYIAAIQILHRLSKIFLLDTITDIFCIIEHNKLTLKYKNKILNYIDTQWYDNKANKLLHNTSVFNELPLEAYMYIKEAAYGEQLAALPLFSNFPAEVIAAISVITRSYILPPNQVLYYRGEIPDDFYILDKGYFKVIQNITNRSTKYLKPPEGVAVMEAFLRMPIINTIVTVTHCCSLCINFPELMLLLLKYPECKEHIENVIKETKKIDSILFRDEVKFTDNVIIDQGETSESFRKFGYNPKVDSLEQRDYDKPFEKLTVLYFVHYLLMRTTILPSGKFLFYWEIGRCVCAFLSSILFSDNEISTCINCVWFIVVIILDIMAWIDIYLRLHIGYYNEKNCLVTHPLKTAVYYLKRSFIIDLIAVFPFGSIVFFITGEKYYKLVMIFQLNRVIQMHRFIGFFTHLEKTNLKHTRVFYVLVEYLPLIVVACLVTGGLIRGIFCQISSDIRSDSPNLTDGIKCNPNSWIHSNSFTKPLTPYQVRLYSIYIATIIFSQSAMPGFRLHRAVMVIMLIPITIFAYLLMIHIIGKTIAQFTSTDSTRVTYQESLKSVNRFMDDYRVDADLAKQLILHFELKWSRKKGKNIHVLLRNFHLALKTDIFYDIYGETLQKVSVFTAENKAFFRSIVLVLNHDVALKDTFICTINDINTTIYFVFKGQIDVIAADGTVINSLGPGSMFGTLDNCKISRQMVGIRATVHTDILMIQSETFHTILKQYTHIQQQFKRLTAFNVDFLKGRGTLSSEQEVPDFKNKFNFFRNPIMFVKTIVFNPDSNFIQIWKFFTLLIISTLEVYFTLYQIAVKEFSVGFVIFQYTCDVFHLIQFFISLHTAYENKVGVIITDTDMIRYNFHKEKLTYYLQFISIIPLDIFVWPLPNKWFYTLHPILRLNRLLRFFYIIVYFREQQEKINCKLYVRYLYIILVTTLILHISTCTFIKIGCGHDKGNVQPPMKCDFQSFTILEKLEVYITYYNVISFIYSVSYQNDIFPDSPHMTAYFILLMILISLIRVVMTAQIYIIIQMTCSQQNKFSLYITKVKNYLENQRVSLYIVKKTWTCLVLLWQYHRGAAFPELLNEAPKMLQEQILNSAFSYHIDRHIIFKQCHIDFNRQLVSYLRNFTYFRHDYIVLEGCVNQCMYFIHTGAVSVLSIDDTNRETVITTLKNGASFGILQGLSKREPHSYSYRSATTTVILTLKYSMWEHLLKFFPASQEMINDCKRNYVDIGFSTV